MKKIIIGACAYLMIGWIIGLTFGSWTEQHCRPPATPTEVAMVAIFWPFLIGNAIIIAPFYHGSDDCQ